MNLSDSNLKDSNLRGTNLRKCNLSNTDLRDTYLQCRYLVDAMFFHTKMQNNKVAEIIQYKNENEEEIVDFSENMMNQY
ncbi:pentapeptide repeat-containing protein [Calothrix membranacea FACHB-236]|nr:pentapeptide repeat-containing protein [Calothrix membranacea FACHB-236]